MSGHAVLAPSSAERNVPCPASVKLEALYPEAEDRQDALEGTAAHWALAEMLAGRDVAVGARSPDGAFITQEMLEGAGIMVDDIEVMLQHYGMAPTDGAIEVAVSIPRVHPTLCWGTPDFRAWLPTHPRPTLLLYDFKFGHRIVEVFENWQMIYYAAGCMSATKLPDTGIDVIIKIVQPRAYHRDGPVREWRFNGADIRAQVNLAAMAAENALGPDPRAKAGPHCRDCRARHACPTLQRAGYAAMDEAGKALPLELTPEAMGLELVMISEAIKRLEARKSGLEAQVHGTLKRGGRVPGWVAASGQGREKWTLPDGQVIALGRLFNLDVAKPPEAVTPKQAAKLGMPVAGLTERTTGALELVRDDGSLARRVFG